MISKKYIIDRNTGGMPKNLSISDVIIARNLKNNRYRKKNRISVLTYLYRNSINPKTYIDRLSYDGMKLMCFYFNVVLIDKYSKDTLSIILERVITEKLIKFHNRVMLFWEHTVDSEELIRRVKTKV